MPASQSPRSFFVSEAVELLFQIHRTQSFTEAAQNLGVSQSVASRKLVAFENALKTTLVDRSTRPVNLTADGKEVLETCRPFLNSVPELIESLRTKNHLRIDLRIDVLDSFTRVITSSLISTINKQITHCTILSGTSDHLYSRFLKDEIDIFISSDPSIELKDMRKKFFYGEPSLLVLPNSFPLENQSLTWSNLRLCGLPYIGLSKATGGGKLFQNFLVSHDIPILQKYNVDNNSVLLELVDAGLGWTISRPSGVLQHVKYLPNIQLRAMPAPTLSREVFLVSRNSVPFSLFQTIFEALTRITQKKLAKETIEIAPWLEEEIFTVDLDNEKKISFSSVSD